jgi:hypothetical protein
MSFWRNYCRCRRLFVVVVAAAAAITATTIPAFQKGERNERNKSIEGQYAKLGVGG